MYVQAQLSYVHCMAMGVVLGGGGEEWRGTT